MADNVSITAGSGTTIAADDIGGVLHQRVKLSLGADGTANDASAGAGSVGTGTQRVTLASDDPAVAKLGTIDTDTGNIAGDTATLAGAVSGSEMQVDVVTSALPTGAATSAKQDTQTTAQQAIQTSVELIDDAIRAEDVASADGHKGVVMMAARMDTPDNTSGTDGDYEIPKMKGGRMWVDASGKTLTVDGSGVTQPISHAALTELASAINSNLVDVNIVSGAGSGGTAQADDADFTAGTTQGTPAQGVYESTPTTVTDGDLGTVGITSGRRLKTSATIDAALPAGTANIGDVDVFSNTAKDGSGTRYQPLVDTDGHLQVDVLSGGGSGTQYTEGDTDASITGNAILWEDGSDTLRAVSAAKPLPIGDAGGSLTVDNGGTFATQVDGAALTALQLIDDPVATDDTTTHSTGTTKVMGIGAVAAPTDASVNANDIGMPAMTTDRKLHVAVMDALPAGTAAIGKLSANSGVDIGDVDITSIAAGDNNIGNVDIVTMPNVTLAAGTNTNEVVGDVAHDAAVAGNPVLVGFEARDSLGTAVATGDAVRVSANRYGHQLQTAIPPSHASSNGTPITATTTSVISAPAASSHLRVMRIHISNGGSTATWVSVRDGAAGTQHYRTYLMQGSAISLNLNASGPLDLTTATRLDIVLSAAGSVEYEIDYLTVAD